MRTSSGCDETAPSGKFSAGACAAVDTFQSPGVATFSETMPAEMLVALGFQCHSCCGVFLRKRMQAPRRFVTTLCCAHGITKPRMAQTTTSWTRLALYRLGWSSNVRFGPQFVQHSVNQNQHHTLRLHISTWPYLPNQSIQTTHVEMVHYSM